MAFLTEFMVVFEDDACSRTVVTISRDGGVSTDLQFGSKRFGPAYAVRYLPRS